MKDSAYYDRKPLKTRHQLESCIRQAFKSQQKILRDIQKENGISTTTQSFGVYCERRTEALMQYMAEIQKRFSSMYPDLMLDYDCIRAESHCIRDYELMEERYHLATAAAIWLLDALKTAGKLEEAYARMNAHDVIEPDDVEMPGVYDVVHPQESIELMTWIIQTRNDGLQNEDDYCYVIDEGTARKRRISSPFRDIVAMLDAEVVQRTTEVYQASVWAWLDCFFRLNADYSRKRNAALENVKRIKRAPKPDISSFQNLSPAAPFFQHASRYALDGMGSADQDLEAAIQRLSKAENELNILDLCVHRSADRAEEIGPKAVKAFEGYRAMDPFAASFALFWLLDSGSNFPFLYFAGIGALEESCQNLPWSPQHDDLLANMETDKTITIPETGIAGDWYARAKKLYDATGCLIPRNSGLYQWADKAVGKKLSPAAAILLDMRDLERKQTRFLLSEFDEDDGESDDPENTAPEEDIPDDRLREEIKAYRQEVEALRRQLHEARRDAQDERQKRETDAAAHESERQELIDLRNYVFSLSQEDDAPEEETPPQIQWPYAVKKRILVFGGHDSWLKVIRGMLEGVRWIDKGERVNPDAIKRADIVFIQTNAMPHRMFYPVDEACKKYKVPMRYCCSASAERCALQIAQADMGQ